jgi:hypothetical protein
LVDVPQNALKAPKRCFGAFSSLAAAEVPVPRVPPETWDGIVYGFTFCDSAADVLVVKLELPPYTAVIECVPSASVETANVAFPLVSVPVPRVVLPSLNVTVPVGVPVPGAVAVKVAVNVTLSPLVDGFNEDATFVEVAALSTTSETTAEVLPMYLESPP